MRRRNRIVKQRTARHRRNAVPAILRTSLALCAFAILASSAPANAAVISNGLVGYWPGDGNANDASPNANHGVFGGTYVPGVFGSAFDLSTGTVNIPDSPAYALDPNLTVSFWFNMNGRTNAVFLGQDAGGGDHTKWFIDYNFYNAGGFDVLPYTASGIGTFLPSQPVTLTSGWNHFALVKSANSYNFFLNGSGIGSQTSGLAFPDPHTLLNFGHLESGHDFTGLMDEVSIYNRALSNPEVAIVASVPEPASLSVVLLGGAALLIRRRA